MYDELQEKAAGVGFEVRLILVRDLDGLEREVTVSPTTEGPQRITDAIETITRIIDHPLFAQMEELRAEGLACDAEAARLMTRATALRTQAEASRKQADAHFRAYDEMARSVGRESATRDHEAK